jgi:hypothetical protein
MVKLMLELHSHHLQRLVSTLLPTTISSTSNPTLKNRALNKQKTFILKKESVLGRTNSAAVLKEESDTICALCL